MPYDEDADSGDCFFPLDECYPEDFEEVAFDEEGELHELPEEGELPEIVWTSQVPINN